MRVLLGVLLLAVAAVLIGFDVPFLPVGFAAGALYCFYLSADRRREAT